MARVQCSVEDCDRGAVSRGWCGRHYQRWQKHGTVEWTRSQPLKYRFVDKVDPIPDHGSGCWLWTGATGTDGYGAIKIAGKIKRAHRVAWELKVGPIPDGLLVLHHCDTPRCVRVDHLFVGTQRDNIQDMLAKGRRPAHWKHVA